MLLLAPLCLALLGMSPQGPATITVSGLDGEVLTAQVVEIRGDKVRLKTAILGGTMTVSRNLADFTPLSVFRIGMAATPPNDFASHFAMARKAGELRLLYPAGSEARAAVDSVQDPAEREQKRVEVRTWAADTLETMVHEAIHDERADDAHHCLKLLSTRLPELRSEGQLDELAGAVAALDDRVTEARRVTRRAQLDAKETAVVDRALERIRERLTQGDTFAREAIRKSGSTVAAGKLCKRAVASYEAGAKDLAALVEKHDDEPLLAKEATLLAQQFQDHGVRAALHAANLLTVQSDYKGAMEWATSVLAYDPDNGEAKEMIRTIQLAAAAAGSAWHWGWSTVGSGGAADPRRR
jgi:hypothetical protein